MTTHARLLLLGSASPRRRELLTTVGLEPLCLPVLLDESVREGERPHDYVRRMAEEKLAALLARPEATQTTARAALTADTTVVLGEESLGKPADARAALDMLRRLAGREHVVLTAFALCRAPFEASRRVVRVVESRVEFRAATEDELRRYADTGEGLDKAGAYAIQGLGMFLVRRIVGSYSSIVGLPLCELVEELRRLEVLEAYP